MNNKRTYTQKDKRRKKAPQYTLFGTVRGGSRVWGEPSASGQV